MTNLQELISQIETISFEVQFTVISNFKILPKVLERNEIIERLIQAIQANQSDADIVFRRLEHLAENKPESGYMHQHDIPALVYLYALNAADYPSMALSALTKVQTTPGFYWAYKFAEYIRDDVIRHMTHTISFNINSIGISDQLPFLSLKTNTNDLDFSIVSEVKGRFGEIDLSITDTETHQDSWYVAS
jgi:hypothetical protein